MRIKRMDNAIADAELFIRKKKLAFETETLPLGKGPKFVLRNKSSPFHFKFIYMCVCMYVRMSVCIGPGEKPMPSKGD